MRNPRKLNTNCIGGRFEKYLDEQPGILDKMRRASNRILDLDDLKLMKLPGEVLATVDIARSLVSAHI